MGAKLRRRVTGDRARRLQAMTSAREDDRPVGWKGHPRVRCKRWRECGPGSQRPCAPSHATDLLEMTTTTMTAGPLPVSSSDFFDVVQAHLDGVATADDMVLLNTHQQPWVAALLRLLDDAALAIDRANRELKGHERALVVADFEREWQRIDEVLTQLVGQADPPTSSNSSRKSSRSHRRRRAWRSSNWPGPPGVSWPGRPGTTPRPSTTMNS